MHQCRAAGLTSMPKDVLKMTSLQERPDPPLSGGAAEPRSSHHHRLGKFDKTPSDMDASDTDEAATGGQTEGGGGRQTLRQS